MHFLEFDDQSTLHQSTEDDIKLGKVDKLVRALVNRSQLFWKLAGLLLVCLIGLADYATGYEVNFSLFYLIPIALVAWFADQNLGMAISLLSAVTWLTADIGAGHIYSQPILYVWNALISLAFFLVTTYLISKLRIAQETQRTLARTDFISSAVNTRYFNELLELEVERLRRYHHPFTLVFIDVDNFKVINDQFGHSAGDSVIHFIANELKQLLRNTDIVARLGGDEFALLLPFTDQPAAEVAVAKLHTELTAKVRKKSWPITFSMGSLTCENAPSSSEELVEMADRLMYTVKNSTKDNICFSVFRGETSLNPSYENKDGVRS